MCHERRAEYHLICVAADPTVTSLSAAVPVVISVGDVNDNSPAFSAGSDVIRVPWERATVGHVVGRVEARDADDGPNGEVIYWAEPVDNDTAVDVFSVDPRSGDITLADPRCTMLDPRSGDITLADPWSTLVDLGSGDVTLVADVDEPAVGESVVYALSVTAGDRGEPPRRSRVLLSIVVERQPHLGPGYRVGGGGGAAGLVGVGWKWIALIVVGNRVTK